MRTIETGPDFPPELSNAPDLPYPVRTRGLELVYVIIYCAIGIMLGGLIGYDVYRKTNQTPWLFQLFATVWCIAALYRLWMLATPYLIFYPDRLEKREWTGWRVIRRADIKGIRTGDGDRAGKLLEIVSRNGDRSIMLREAVRNDPVVKRWFAGVYDLTAEELEADRKAVLGDFRYGATEAERATRLKRAKTVALIFNLACVAVAVGLWFSPDQYQLHLACVVGAPLVAALLIHAYNGLIVWISTGKARPGVIGAVAPAVAVAYFRADEIHIVHFDYLVWGIVAAALLVTALWAARGQTTFNWRALPGVFIFAGMGIYGVASLADLALAPTGTKIFPVRVLDKYESGSRSRFYNLKLSPWSDQPSEAISVSSSHYSNVAIGSAVCVNRHPGALSLDWFEIKDCPPGLKPPPLLDVQTEVKAKPPQFKLEFPQSTADSTQAVVRCAVKDKAHLAGCQVIAETPIGSDLGAKAIQALADPRTTIQPAQLKGQTTIDVLASFKLQAAPPAVPVAALPPLGKGKYGVGTYYPPRAQALGKEGRVMVQCNVGDDMIVTDCKVLSEDPPDFGFGEAAVHMMEHHAKMDPAKLKGNRTVSIPVAFRLAK